MDSLNWADTLQAAITVCDLDGTIIYMNQTSKDVFAKSGGEELLGKSLFECHSNESVQKIKELMQSGTSNHYTIQKNGKKKMILQTPVFEHGKVTGMVEVSFEIPEQLPHFNRDAA